MQIKETIIKLEDHIEVYRSILIHISDKQAVWKPSEDQWSLLQVVNHLLDEEIHDFRQRIEHSFNVASVNWKRIEPLKWAKENRYENRHYIDVLNSFLMQRRLSVRFLRSYYEDDWKRSDNYPYGDPMTAEATLYSWLAHDYLHFRQINRLCYQFYDDVTGEQNLGYAGKW
jgi:hypothetical protein